MLGCHASWIDRHDSLLHIRTRCSQMIMLIYPWVWWDFTQSWYLATNENWKTAMSEPFETCYEVQHTQEIPNQYPIALLHSAVSEQYWLCNTPVTNFWLFHLQYLLLFLRIDSDKSTHHYHHKYALIFTSDYCDDILNGINDTVLPTCGRVATVSIVCITMIFQYWQQWKCHKAWWCMHSDHPFFLCRWCVVFGNLLFGSIPLQSTIVQAQLQVILNVWGIDDVYLTQQAYSGNIWNIAGKVNKMNPINLPWTLLPFISSTCTKGVKWSERNDPNIAPVPLPLY